MRTIKIIGFLKFLYLNFILKPKYLINILSRPSKYSKGKSYYLEYQSKKSTKIIKDQIIQTLKFGYPNFFYFPYGFDVKSNHEVNKYLHFEPFLKLRNKYNSVHAPICVLRDKILFTIFTQFWGIDSGETVAYIDNQNIFDLNSNEIVDFKNFLFRYNEPLIFKPTNGECGKGIFILKKDDNQFYIDGEVVDFIDIINRINNTSYIIQKLIHQHKNMSDLHPQSVNTIRLITIRNIQTGDITVFPSILRIGTGASHVDNTSQGGLAVGINLETGYLKQFGYYKPEFGTKTIEHPDSKIKFNEFKIPFLEEAISQAILLHSHLNDIHSIGWDIAIGETGPIFIEGNDNWEINGPQICNGPLKEIFYASLGIN